MNSKRNKKIFGRSITVSTNNKKVNKYPKYRRYKGEDDYKTSTRFKKRYMLLTLVALIFTTLVARYHLFPEQYENDIKYLDSLEEKLGLVNLEKILYEFAASVKDNVVRIIMDNPFLKFYNWTLGYLREMTMAKQ